MEDGTPFGRYRLLELLGRGGMGEVWRAFDSETQRVVAVKVLTANLASDPAFEQRFRREAFAAAGLNDPHVIPIHQFGEIEGRLYVDMRLVEGRDLESMLADGALGPARAVGIIEQVASALHAAHRVGLVHRDVKPSNILLTEDDFAYLIDFGIARAAGQTGLTSAGSTIGTWAYMAPERFTTGIADARADVYALTCVLHQSLTGQVPFPGASLEQQVAGHLTLPPPRPSTLNNTAPTSLDGVIARGMAKHPHERFATTKDLARAARDAVTRPTPLIAAAPAPFVTHPTQPVTPQPNYPRPQPNPAWPSPGQPPESRRSSRNRTLVIVSAVVVALIVVAVIATFALRGSGGTTTSTVAGPGTPPSTVTTTTTTSAPPKPIADINRVLLSPADVNTITDTTGLTGTLVSSIADDNTNVVPAECHSITVFASPRELGNSGYTKVLGQRLSNNGAAFAVQAVFQFASPQIANDFVDSLIPLWESCRGKTITESNSSGASLQYDVRDVTTGEHKVTAVNGVLGRSTVCQSVLQAATVFVVRSTVCKDNVGNAAVTIASRIVANIENT